MVVVWCEPWPCRASQERVTARAGRAHSSRGHRLPRARHPSSHRSKFISSMVAGSGLVLPPDEDAQQEETLLRWVGNPS